MQGQLLLSEAPSDLNIIHAKGLQLKHPAIGMATQHSCGHGTAETLSARQQKKMPGALSIPAGCLPSWTAPWEHNSAAFSESGTEDCRLINAACIPGTSWGP